MKRMFLGSVVIAVVCAWGLAAYAQSAAPAVPDIPRTADGHPDFTGIYQWPTYLQGDERGKSRGDDVRPKELLSL